MFSFILRCIHFILLEMGSLRFDRQQRFFALCLLPHTGKDLWGGKNNFIDHTVSYIYTHTHLHIYANQREREMSSPASQVHHPFRVRLWCEDGPDFFITERALLLLLIILKHYFVRTKVMAKGHKPTCSSTCFSTLLLSSATSASFSPDKN